MTQGGKGRLREQAIQALLSGAEFADAAATVGISLRTMLRWWGQPEFAKEYSDRNAALGRAKTARMRAITDSLLKKGYDATETLDAISKNVDAPAGARGMCAREIVKLGREGYQLEDLEARLLKLEQNLKEEQ